MFLLHTRAHSLLMRPMILAATCFCIVGTAAAQTAGDTVRARVGHSVVWISGRFVRFDSALVMDQAGKRLQLQREDLLQVQVRRRRSPLVFLALGAGVALAGYHTARLIAGPDSRWACDGCGFTWHEDRDYYIVGAGGMIVLGTITYFIWPPRWKTVFGG